ncbi:MAG: PA14 domain-containing protein [Bacteroidota bacterium]|nr:PA14 domain-containing protein [Bacteroidota bacterium]
MIQLLTGKYQKHVAWLLFLVFYGELAGNLYAGMRILDRTGVYHGLSLGNKRFTYGSLAAATMEKSAHDRDSMQIERMTTNNIPVDGNNKTTIRNADKPDIGGPGQPEMTTFKSIGTDNMVNLFTGDFSYNIPLLDVGGYPVNIFYNAGANMDQEASWVGLGWNINPGTINRNMRGLPDDFNGDDSITKVQSIRDDRTIGVTGSTGGEVVGIPGLSASLNAGVFYNNRRGLGLEFGAKGDYSIYENLSVKVKDDKTTKDTTAKANIGSLSGGIDLNSQNGMTLNAGFSVYGFTSSRANSFGLSTSVGYSSRQGLTDVTIGGEYQNYRLVSTKKGLDLATVGSQSVHTGNLSFARSSFTPSIRMPLTTSNRTYSIKFGKEKKVWFKNGTVTGYIQESSLDVVDTMQKKPAYGFMYYEKATADRNAMMDFNRLNDGVFTFKKPIIDLPVYTYDVFTINGEGTGGSFRGYRGNLGYMRDNDTRNKSVEGHINLDLGAGDILHVGVVLGGVYSPSFVNEWQLGNALRYSAKFNKTDSIYQSFYFKNPGEKAIIDENYYQKMGADQLIRPYLLNAQTATPMLASGYEVYDNNKKFERTIDITADSRRKDRDKRTQVITYLTAEDATKVGLDTQIYSYPENVFTPGSCANSLVRTAISRYNPKDPTFYRKAHHISEIDVLEGDGRRYVYDIPVYQVSQKEVTFSTEATPNSDNQFVGYTPGLDNTTGNSSGRDWFYQSETVKGYAHSFLLTGILSPDYVDVTGDGITDDDLGTAIKLNYSRVDKKTARAGGNSWNNFKWRMPVAANTANYNGNLKADSRDDKAMYTYGVKELWYLHSIESKNMVATFYTSVRHDGHQVAGENGGIVTGGELRKLDKINLYTKADYLKNGDQATPIKTVHFQYTYELCKHYALNDNSDSGKLTLKAIWFSYNGNNNQVKNKYVFKYASSSCYNGVNVNPDYNSTENDRWGEYKPHSQNPAGMLNNDYSYTLQDQTKSNAYAAAWNLESILLPGGAVMKVKYEADDYAFVQNRRACQMTAIAGFAQSATATGSAISNALYARNFSQVTHPGDMDNRFVFFDAAETLTAVEDIKARYLQGMSQLLLKLWVNMPSPSVGRPSAYEPVTIYGAIKSYGFAKTEGGADDHNRFYIELEKTRNGGSPIMETVMQFLKDMLPARAYPGYEVNGDGGIIQVVRAVFGLIHSFTQGVLGFEKDLKMLNKCHDVLLSQSFARLENPDLKKIGGGHRVKSIIISDNWKKMTEKVSGDGLPDSYYGQVYDYTTTELVNGQSITASSGVASYEPGIGNEENPFREVLRYYDHQFLGPTDYSNVELPVAETFFPSPMIGYSRVTVRSIHNKENKNIKSGIGRQQTEFYTTRDFPVISDYTDFDDHSWHHHKPTVIEKVFNFNKKDYMTLTQGFRVVLNDMNGKLKSQTSYAENDDVTPVNYTANYYRMSSTGDNKFSLDNELPVISGPDGKITTKLVGRDVEVMNDCREHFSYTYSANIPLNGEFFHIGIIPIILPTIFRLAFRDESSYRSATALKVVNEYGILDSVINIDKGSKVGTRNLVYDAETGDVLISRTNNEFNKPVYQFNYPAWWVNSGMEPAYRNIDLTYSGILFRNGRIEGAPDGFTFDHFESGDELFVDTKDTKGPPESPACVTEGYPATLPLTSEYRIWAIDITKDLRNTVKQFIFVDRYGNPCNAANATLRIIRSGKRNLAGASAGSIVSLANPIRTRLNGLGQEEQWVILDDTSNVINAAAAEFKERWRANDMFYAKDTTIVTTRSVPIQTVNIPVVSTDGTHSYGTIKRPGHNRDNESFQNTDYFVGRQFEQGNHRSDATQKSWLLFDFSSFSPNYTVVSAKLTLYAHTVARHDIGFGNFISARHGMTDPHVVGLHPNSFFLHRTLAAWPAQNNDAAWANLFDLQQTGSLNELYRPPPGGATTSYLYDPFVGRDNRILVTDLVKGMLRDKYDLTKQYATALRISLATNGSGESRVCFFAKDPPDSHVSYLPSLEVKYYDCSDDGGVLLRTNAQPPVSLPDSAKCPTTETIKYCYSVFSKKQMNPYVEGVLGNWRGWRSYVYYSNRRESDPTVPTDIRKNGIIKDFEPYWSFTDNPDLKLGRTNSTKWVWNAEITQYNRKGAELENHDPLERYNAGIYGYQESLPIAVVNNSRLRLSAFDGFEDYSYQDDPCEPYCKPSKRHFPTGITSAMLVDAESHTGKYSLRVAANATYQIGIHVTPDDTTSSPDIRVKLDSNAVSQITMITPPKGVGLTGSYYHNTTFTGSAQVREDKTVNLHFRSFSFLGVSLCASSNSYDYSFPFPQCVNVSAKWNGKIQVERTGEYNFDIPPGKIDDIGHVYVNGTLVVTSVLNGTHTTTPITLTAGVLYPIVVDFVQTLPTNAYIQLFWKKPGDTQLSPVPSQNLYPVDKDYLADGTTTVNTIYCVKPDTIQAINHQLIDSFNLVPGTKMVASVWMKKGGQNCKCTAYNNNFAIRNANGDLISSFTPKEGIIEGWQQFETIFTVPSTSKILLDLKAPPDAEVFIDDLRLHPFNANMKSFVYDPITLRLASELDENNFASFYEYDDDGGLVRVKKETKAGIKTITETRSAVQKKITTLE